MAVVIGALVAIAVVIGLAFLISGLDSGASEPLGSADRSSSPAGASAAAPTAARPATATAPPSGIDVKRGVVPALIGQPAAAAVRAIAEAGFQAVETRAKSPNVPRGSVIDQSPAPGSPLAEGQTVRIIISDGP
jgi:hypothetical protein